MLFYLDPLSESTVIATFTHGESRGRVKVRVALSQDKTEVLVLSETFNTGHVNTTEMVLPLELAKEMFPQLADQFK